IVLPLLITPLYVAPSSWLARHKPPVPMEGLAGFEIINTMEKLSAAMVAARSVRILYGALRRLVSVRASLVLAGVYAFGSTTWAISSQALWRHGLSELALAGALWGLTRPVASRSYGCLVGRCSGLACQPEPRPAYLHTLDVFRDLGRGARLEEEFAPLGSLPCAKRIGRLSRACRVRRMVGRRLFRPALLDGHPAVFGFL